GGRYRGGSQRGCRGRRGGRRRGGSGPAEGPGRALSGPFSPTRYSSDDRIRVEVELQRPPHDLRDGDSLSRRTPLDLLGDGSYDPDLQDLRILHTPLLVSPVETDGGSLRCKRLGYRAASPVYDVTLRYVAGTLR